MKEKRKNGAIATHELCDIICDAIREEPYFTKEVLIPKIKTLITAFRLRLSTVTYNAIEQPNEKQRMVRANELLNQEVNFWKERVRELAGSENMKKYYDQQDEMRKIWLDLTPQKP